MSSTSIKRFNHRVFPCDLSRKIELINHLLSSHSDINVAIISKESINNFKDITSNENVKILTDETLQNEKPDAFEMMIHYDLPDEVSTYFKRLDYVKNYSFIILDPNEQKALYPVETTLGRSLINEVVKGFETTVALEKKKEEVRKKKKAKRYKKELEAQQAQKEAAKAAKTPKRNVRKVSKKS